MIRVDIYHHLELGSEILTLLGALSRQQDLTNQKLEKIMATLDEDLAVITAQGARLDSLNTFVLGIEQQLKDALADTTLPPDVQAKVDAIFAGIQANDAKIDTALNSGVPAPAA